MNGASKPKILALAFTLFVASCAQTPKPNSQIAGNPSLATNAPLSLVVAQPMQAMDQETIDAAQRDLRTLGYAAGKLGDSADPTFQHAIMAFEKDQGLAQDGYLTPTLLERLRQVRSQLPKTFPVATPSDQMLVYSDGSERRQPLALLLMPPAGLTSDAPTNFLQLLRPETIATYHFGHHGKDGNFTIVANVTCKIGRVIPLNAPLGLFDSLPVECSAEGKGMSAMHWRSFYAIKLGQVVRQEGLPAAGSVRDLIAIRPITVGWPSAARAGLDWAISHALEAPVSAAPVQWSSTAVLPHFEVRAMAAMSPHDAGLPGGSALSCRRFDLLQSGEPVRHYPGVACRNAKGNWSLAQSRIELASPASGLARQSAL